MRLQSVSGMEVHEPSMDHQEHREHQARAYLPMMVFLAFLAFLLTGFGTGLGIWQPVPVFLFLCLVLLTLQEHIAETRSLAHRTYTFLTSSFAVIYAGEVAFGVKSLDFTHAPVTYVLAEAVLLVVFVGDTVVRHRRRNRLSGERASSARFGDWAIDMAGIAVFFYATAFLLDLLGGQTVLRHLGLQIGSAPYVVVDLNHLFGLHLGSPANLLEGLDLVLGLAATAAALGMLTMAGVALPSVDHEDEYTDGMRSFAQVLVDGAGQVLASLRLVLGPLIWLIPAFSVAAFADYVAQYFNASARATSGVIDLFNPFSPTSRENIGLGISTLLLGVLAVVAMVVAVSVLEQNSHVIHHTIATFRDAARAITLTWALFMYSLASINAAAILLSVTKAAPFQVGAPGLFAMLLGVGALLYENARVSKPHPPQLPRTAPLIDRAPVAPPHATPTDRTPERTERTPTGARS